LHYDTARNSL